MGSLELFLMHHTATPGTADDSQNTVKCAWDIRTYTGSLWEKKNRPNKEQSTNMYLSNYRHFERHQFQSVTPNLLVLCKKTTVMLNATYCLLFKQEFVKITEEAKTWNAIWWYKYGISFNAEYLRSSILVNWQSTSTQNYEIIKFFMLNLWEWPPL